MRSLTSVDSSTQPKTALQIDITPVDQSTTYVFSNWHIQNLTPISYEIGYMGGFGKSSTYNVTLSRDDGLTFWKSSFQNLIKAQVSLTVNVNSDSFTPHVGIVQDIKRFANDPNLIQLQIFDKFFNNIPQYPIAAIVDSYTGVHPEISNNNWGYPAYYGEHARPFYMTPVDCDLGTLVGPINVSSENHVTSLFFNPEKAKGATGNHLFLLNNKIWEQQSGSTNIASSALGFQLRSQPLLDNRIIKFTGQMLAPLVAAESDTLIGFHQQGLLSGTLNKRVASDRGDGWFEIIKTPAITFLKANQIQINGTATAAGGISEHDFTIYVKSGGTLGTGVRIEGTTATRSLDIDITSNELSILADESGGVLVPEIKTTTSASLVTYQLSMDVQAQAESINYTNYSVFGQQVNCSDIAISTNPIHILTDIFSQSTLGFRQSQASDTQLNLANSGFNFQCFFGERQKLSDISQEFGTITGTYIYISDSGFINFRTYQESAGATIDATITPNDYLENSLVIRDNPLGTTVFNTAKAKRIAIAYNYNFTTQQYENSLIADANNTAACNSIAATGINEEFTTQTKYILESATTSLYLGNLIRKKTSEEQIIECTLPAQYFGLELADIVKLQHPMLNNSESLYQITKLNPDYLRGQVKITANELINL